MPKYLVILESPGKTGKFSHILGPNYKVIASLGHVVDLPSKGKNVKISKDKTTGKYSFVPNFQVMDDKKEVMSNITKEALKKYDTIYLAMDPDREGSGIAFGIAERLPKGCKYLRATTNSITKQEVEDAIKNAGPIDLAMVNSFEARRILDRVVGYECSFLTQTATGGKSVGRVQSAALRLLAEREQEIKDFKPEEYWDIRAELLTKNKEKILTKLTNPDEKDIKNKTVADEIVSFLKLHKKAKVSKHETKIVENNAYAPFTTSTLQQTASSILGWNGKKTMSIAQNLYTSGDISYMRTDSMNLAPSFVSSCRSYIQSNFDAKYLPVKPNLYKTASKSAQEAHEACRVTDVTKLIAGNDDDERKLYKLIWKRSVACQMEKSRHQSISVKFESGKYELSVNGRKLLFDGWKKVYDYALSDDVILPDLQVGEELNILDVSADQKFTSPPPRYTDGGSFTSLMEKNGIGRPSTFNATLETLKSRDYIKLDKKSISVTDLGMGVVAFLKKADFCFIDVGFTANVEDDLDLIADKKTSKEDVLNEFYVRLKKDIENATKIKEQSQITNFKCEKCKGNNIDSPLLKKHSKFGPFFGCSNKECKTIYNIDSHGQPVAKTIAQLNYSDKICPNCQEKFVIRTSKTGKEYLGCKNWNKDKSCSGFFDMDGKKIEFKKKVWKKWKKKTT